MYKTGGILSRSHIPQRSSKHCRVPIPTPRQGLLCESHSSTRRGGSTATDREWRASSRVLRVLLLLPSKATFPPSFQASKEYKKNFLWQHLEERRRMCARLRIFEHAWHKLFAAFFPGGAFSSSEDDALKARAEACKSKWNMYKRSGCCRFRRTTTRP